MIGIIGAMPQEVAELKKFMELESETVILNYTFYVGKINQHECVLVQGGIGKVNAAISATLLCEKYNIDYLINIGSAGGLMVHQNVGDLVISESIQYHDVDVTAFGYSYGQMAGEPEKFMPDHQLVEIVKNTAKELNMPYHYGLIVSGDTFVCQLPHVDHIKTYFNNAMCSEMEAAAIAHVCHVYKIPFVIIRALSDIFGKGENSVQFDEFIVKASQASALLCTKVIEKI